MLKDFVSLEPKVDTSRITIPNKIRIRFMQLDVSITWRWIFYVIKKQSYQITYKF